MRGVRRQDRANPIFYLRDDAATGSCAHMHRTASGVTRRRLKLPLPGARPLSCILAWLDSALRVCAGAAEWRSSNEQNGIADPICAGGRGILLRCRRARNRSSWASSTATRRFRRFSRPTSAAWTWRSSRSTRAGGLLGRPVELIVRDDTGNPGDAVRVAEELVSREKVDILMGTFSSAVGLAIADFAKQRQRLFLASEPLTDKIVWENGNKYTFRLRPVDLHADRDAGAGGGASSASGAGRSSIPTTSTASRQPRHSSSR